MENIGIIGLGGAGGNIADYASTKGFHTAAINFSQKDLDALPNIRLKLRVVGTEGVGHNREEAVRLFGENHLMAINFILENFTHVDALIFPFSTGGGSGSGMSAILMEVLQSKLPEKVFIAMPILPDITEATFSQINTLRTFEDLSELDVAILPIDNNRVREQHEVGKGRLYQITNQGAISLIEKIVSYTEKHSSNGNFDKQDFLNLFKPRGIVTIAEADVTTLNHGAVHLTKEGLTQLIQESWQKSIFAPIEYGQITKAGLIFDGQEELMECIDLTAIFGKFANYPLDVFEAYHHQTNGNIITVLSGLAWCKTRLDQIENIIGEQSERIEAVFSSDQQVYKSSATSLLNRISSTTSATSNRPKKSTADILDKYRNNR